MLLYDARGAGLATDAAILAAMLAQLAILGWLVLKNRSER